MLWKRIAQLRRQWDEATSTSIKKITGAFGKIAVVAVAVGAATETELKEKKMD